MRFRHKLLLMPALAALFVLALLGTSVEMGRRTGALMERIQTGHAPAVTLTRDLEGYLDQTQRILEEGVRKRDEDALERADKRAARFRERLGEEKDNPVVTAAWREALLRDFDGWLHEARYVSALMMADDSTAAARMAQVQARFDTLQHQLAETTHAQQDAQAEAFAAVQGLHVRTRQVMLGLGLSCVVLLVGASLWLADQMTRPLAQLTAVAGRIAAERDLTVEVPVSGTDEVGQLAASFRAMVTQLRTMASTLRQESSALSGVVHALQDVSRRQAETLEEQAVSLGETSRTVQEIRQTSQQASAKAGQVLAEAAEAERAGQEGQRALEASVGQLESLQAEVDGVARAIQGLSGHAGRASQVVLQVKDLADQSNMLALNAGIEATRAGDSGRSFAVVAREMRSLANQSLKSTGDIKSILVDLAGAISGTVERTGAGSARMSGGIGEVRAIGERLQALTQVVQESSRAAREIVASVSAQDAGIAQISGAIQAQGAMMSSLSEATLQAEITVDRLASTFQRLEAALGGFKV
jgi:methyl-accepting chemotaxis protein